VCGRIDEDVSGFSKQIRTDTMKDFVSEIKKINTDGLIYKFSEISIDMFKKVQCWRNVEVPVVRYGKHQKILVQLSAWDIPNIAFLSVKESNDYRHADKVSSVGQLVDLYREYDNEHSAAESIKNAADGVFRVVLGMTAEQFQYQNLWWIFEKFNRDYYILLAAKNFEHRREIDTNAAVKEVFGCSADDYIAILLMIFWLCSQHPDPLSAPESLYCRKENTILTTENITKFVGYYSCDYKELREHSLGKQLLYSKPFIKTQRHGEYLAVSMYLVAMMVGNGLYWLVRDYYFKQGTQKFVNAFGLLFEDYIKDLALNYCETSEYKVLSAGAKKGADFLFDFGMLQLLVESKSSLLKLDAKQQVPNMESTNTFFNRTISEAYTQLNSSYEELKGKIEVPIIKIILLYDEFSNTAIIELSEKEIFEKDNLCFVMTIRELEILLYLHCNDKTKEEQILNKLLDSTKSDGLRKRQNIGAIYDELSIHENQHFDGQMDYFARMVEHFENNL